MRGHVCFCQISCVGKFQRASVGNRLTHKSPAASAQRSDDQRRLAVTSHHSWLLSVVWLCVFTVHCSDLRCHKLELELLSVENKCKLTSPYANWIVVAFFCDHTQMIWAVTSELGQMSLIHGNIYKGPQTWTLCCHEGKSDPLPHILFCSFVWTFRYHTFNLLQIPSTSLCCVVL